MNVLVLGGYGATGVRAVARLRARGDGVVVAGRNPAKADRVIDLSARDDGALRDALADIDVVINATGAEDLRLVTTVASHGVAFVDITATTDYIAALDQLAPAAPVLVNVGLAPGLTNLLAAAVHRAAPGPIDIAVFAGAGEPHGAGGVDWIYGLLGQRFTDPGTGTRVRNYTRPNRFELPGFGPRRLYRANFSDQHTLTRDLGVPVRTYLGLDSRAATATLATAGSCSPAALTVRRGGPPAVSSPTPPRSSPSPPHTWRPGCPPASTTSIRCSPSTTSPTTAASKCTAVNCQTGPAPTIASRRPPTTNL
jgi:saccharopine dehydrogenase-like NADP-dependent oxidoreductase